jgi:Holliday junction resolvasome RuvABC DNA-binding subunit
VQDSPATASFFLLPPWAPAPPAGSARLLDRSLLNFITITVCIPAAGGNCNAVEKLTSASRQEQRLRLNVDHYAATWIPPKTLRGKTVQIRVEVARLFVGGLTWAVKTTAALPIRFRIHNHPIVRARVLHEIGKTATFIAAVLKAEFQLTPTRAAQILFGEQFNALEIGAALRDVYSTTPLQAASILRGLGFNSVEVGNTLKTVFNKSAQDAAQILKDVGYNYLEIATALRDAFSTSPQLASDILRGLGYSSVEVGTALKQVFNQSSADAAKLLKSSGFTLTEIAQALKDAFSESATRIAEIFLNELSITSLVDIVGALTGAGFTESQAHVAVTPALVQSYAPVIHFESEEKYLMSSVDWYLARSRLITEGGQSFTVTKDNLYSTAQTLKTGGAGKLWLDPVDRDDTKPGKLSTATAYLHVYHPPDVPEVFDVQFWYFYPYNGPGRMYTRIGELWDKDSSLAPLGEHVGDWEAVYIRFSDATMKPTAMFLSAHGDYPKTNWEPKYLEDGSHLKVYASRNGHAHYLKTGNNAERVRHTDFGFGHFDVDLYNITDDDGQSFDSKTSYEIIAADATPLPGQDWIKFPGRWGPEEELHLDRGQAIELVYDHMWPGVEALCVACAIPCTPVNLVCLGACCTAINVTVIVVVSAATDDVVDLFAKEERTANGPNSPGWNEKCGNGYSVWFYDKKPDEDFDDDSPNCP